MEEFTDPIETITGVASPLLKTLFLLPKDTLTLVDPLLLVTPVIFTEILLLLPMCDRPKLPSATDALNVIVPVLELTKLVVVDGLMINFDTAVSPENPSYLFSVDPLPLPPDIESVVLMVFTQSLKVPLLTTVTVIVTLSENVTLYLSDVILTL